MRPKSLPSLARTLAPALVLAPLLALGSAGCLVQHHVNTNPLAQVKSDQPDKTLFDIAMADLDKNKYTVARLNLETLLNTYPDSEYLARAKMAIADSWFREGGIEGMAQAEAQYKDFITFFPAMKEASEAQLKVAEIHYRQLQKPDRDPTQAISAQAELRTFLINYPDSPLRPQALQMLRDTQEVLAEGQYRIAQFYLERARVGVYNDYRAAQSRLEETLSRYPLYSRGDIALDELANSFVTTSQLYSGAAHIEVNPQTKDLYAANANTDRVKAIADFSRLIERYPLSPMANNARSELTALHAPIPTPSPAQIAFNRKEIAGRTQAPHSSGMSGVLGLATAMWSGKPTNEIARADKVGTPLLAEPQLAAEAPPPGLDTLLKQSMIATGALKPNQAANVNLGAILTGTGSSNSDSAFAAAAPPAPTAPTPATPAPATAPATPLAFQNVTTQARGADTPESNTPQAMSGSNANDPNARPTIVAPAANVLLTPNDLDIENRDQMLAAEIHRDVPAPLADLQRAAKQQAAAQAKLIALIRKEQAKQAAKKKSPGSPPPAPPKAAPAPAAAAKSKSWFHIWD